MRKCERGYCHERACENVVYNVIISAERMPILLFLGKLVLK